VLAAELDVVELALPAARPAAPLHGVQDRRQVVVVDADDRGAAPHLRKSSVSACVRAAMAAVLHDSVRAIARVISTALSSYTARFAGNEASNARSKSCSSSSVRLPSVWARARKLFCSSSERSAQRRMPSGDQSSDGAAGATCSSRCREVDVARQTLQHVGRVRECRVLEADAGAFVRRRDARDRVHQGVAGHRGGAAQARDEAVGRHADDGAPQQQRLHVLERDEQLGGAEVAVVLV
jgi:hypothetical protein